MPIPNVPNFAQSEVQAELGLGNTALSTCLTTADEFKFDPLYKGDMDRLSNFRNYGGSSDAIGFSTFSSSSSSPVCGYDLDTFKYHNGAGAYPELGDYIYNDSGLSSPFNGLGLYWRFQQSCGSARAIISSSGYVQGGFSTCSDCPAPPNSLLTNCFGYWSFNDSGTSAAIESTGFSNVGANTNITQGITGVVGDAFGFNGTAHVRMLSNARLEALNASTNDYTVSFWVKSADPGASTRVIEYRPNNVGSYPFSVQMGAAKDMLLAAWGSSVKFATIDNADVFDNSWHLVVMRVEANSTISAFLDGSLYDSVGISGIGNATGSGESLTVGGTEADTGHIDADIQQVVLWDRALTDAEVEILWNSGSGLPFNQFG